MNYSKSIRRTQVAKRILVSWLIVAVVFFAVGFLIGHITAYKPTDEQKTAKGTVESLTSEIVVYGAESGDSITLKKIDWEVPNDFEPLDVEMDADLQEFVYCISRAYNIDFTFVMAMIQHESGYQANVVSKTGDYGLMQINEANFEALTDVTGVTNYLDPYQSIIAGCYVLHDLFEKYDDPHRVLMSYNFGEYQASVLWNKGIYSSEYSREVMKIQKELSESR